MATPTRRDFAVGLATAGAAMAFAGHAYAAAEIGKAAGSAPPAAAGGNALANVHPELLEAAKQMLAFTPPPGTRIDIQSMLNYRKVPPAFRPADFPTTSVSRKLIPGYQTSPAVPVYIINARPGDQLPIIVHLHGGGYVLGSPQDNIASLQQQALALKCIIITVDYRLAPEARFPAPLNDAYAALGWAHANAATFGGDPARIAIQGESAGGGLAAMLAHMARDRGEIPLVHQSLIYPMLDDRTGSSRAAPANAGLILWTRDLNRVAWTAFLGTPAGGAAAPSGAVPARFVSLKGLAPAFIGVGSIDLFAREDIEYATRLMDADVATELVVVPGAFHGFDLPAHPTSLGREFRLAQFNALARAFGSQPLTEMPT